MLKEAVLHISDSTYAYATKENTLVIKIRVKKNDMIKVILNYGDRYYPKPDIAMIKTNMELSYSDELYDYYEAEITPNFNRICYYFELVDENGTYVYAQDKFLKEISSERNKLYMFSYICREDIYVSEEEWEGLIFYQIFVDRFNKTDKDESWYKLPGTEDIYGGNLKGILNKLDYISDLGVNCIYLTPIFESPTNHKYDTVDYYSIDKGFGNEEILRELIEKCHERGIKIIFDAVFNHTSNEFFAFKDALQHGKASKYYDWYFFREDGSYETFAAAKSMPKFNTGCKEAADYIIEVSRYWLRKFNIDGWRLDVANEIDHKFWRRFREEVKLTKKDAIIIGEVWDGAESYLQGDQYDSVMNYPIMYASLDYFARKNIDIVEFDNLINNLFVRYKKPTRRILLNVLGSHDTSRFLYECGEDARKLKMAVFFQMTSIGIPMVFYGDEAGLTGKNDPDCRRTINFENMDKELFNYYKKLIGIRRGNSALMHGEFKTVYALEDVYAFKRFTPTETVLNIFNNSSESKELKLYIECSKAVDLINESEEYTVQNNILIINLKPMDKKILSII